MTKSNMALSRGKLLFSRNLDTFGEIFNRYAHKHYNPKFKWLRKMKYLYPDAIFKKTTTDEDKKRIALERGRILVRRSNEIPFLVDCTLDIMDPYVPRQGDGKYSKLTKMVDTALNLTEDGKNKMRSARAAMQIKEYMKSFDSENFAQTALNIYIKAHTALARNDMTELEKYATLHAFSLITNNTKNKTIRWKYIESLDPPKTVQVRVGSAGTKENKFGQVTVRIHSKQMLAIYDRFGRLMYGSEILAKDVLEFCIFEIQLTNLNGSFKLHHKIIPDWSEPRYSDLRTYQKDEEELETTENLEDEQKLESYSKAIKQ